MTRCQLINAVLLGPHPRGTRCDRGGKPALHELSVRAVSEVLGPWRLCIEEAERPIELVVEVSDVSIGPSVNLVGVDSMRDELAFDTGASLPLRDATSDKNLCEAHIVDEPV